MPVSLSEVWPPKEGAPTPLTPSFLPPPASPQRPPQPMVQHVTQPMPQRVASPARLVTWPSYQNQPSNPPSPSYSYAPEAPTSPSLYDLLEEINNMLANSEQYMLNNVADLVQRSAAQQAPPPPATNTWHMV